MRRWYRARRNRKRLRKLKPGDGSRLTPLRWWQLINRTVFAIDVEATAGKTHTYAVDLDFFDWDERVYLYTDGVQTAQSQTPAHFPVPGGHIDVETTLYGLKRMHLVRDDGTEKLLTPHPRSLEGMRAQLAKRHPKISRGIGVAAIAILLTSLFFGLPALAQELSQLELIADNVGTFTSPFDLPSWVSTGLWVAGIAAAMERALTLRNHWLIDLDTTWFGD